MSNLAGFLLTPSKGRSGSQGDGRAQAVNPLSPAPGPGRSNARSPGVDLSLKPRPGEADARERAGGLHGKGSPRSGAAGEGRFPRWCREIAPEYPLQPQPRAVTGRGLYSLFFHVRRERTAEYSRGGATFAGFGPILS